MTDQSIINKARTVLDVAQSDITIALSTGKMDDLTNVPALLEVVQDYLTMLAGDADIIK